MEELKDRLKSARLDAGMTQKQLSDATGITQPVISDLEKGKQQGSAALVKLAEALGVSPSWLDQGAGPRRPTADQQTQSASVVLSEFEKLTPAQQDSVREMIAALAAANLARHEKE